MKSAHHKPKSQHFQMTHLNTLKVQTLKHSLSSTDLIVTQTSLYPFKLTLKLTHSQAIAAHCQQNRSPLCRRYSLSSNLSPPCRRYSLSLSLSTQLWPTMLRRYFIPNTKKEKEKIQNPCKSIQHFIYLHTHFIPNTKKNKTHFITHSKGMNYIPISLQFIWREYVNHFITYTFHTHSKGMITYPFITIHSLPISYPKQWWIK